MAPLPSPLWPLGPHPRAWALCPREPSPRTQHVCSRPAEALKMLPPDRSIHAYALAPAGALSNFPPGKSHLHGSCLAEKLKVLCSRRNESTCCFPARCCEQGNLCMLPCGSNFTAPSGWEHTTCVPGVGMGTLGHWWVPGNGVPRGHMVAQGGGAGWHPCPF